MALFKDQSTVDRGTGNYALIVEFNHSTVRYRNKYLWATVELMNENWDMLNGVDIRRGMVKPTFGIYRLKNGEWEPV